MTGGFGFVVDDGGPDKRSAGSATRFAAQLGEAGLDESAHRAACPACALLAPPFACVGLVPTPIPGIAERWLLEQLPEDIEHTVAGFLLRKAIGDFGYDGARARALRQAGRLEAREAFERHYGPFFRRVTISSEQLLEELLCAGDVAPSHALALLMHLGALTVDGAVVTAQAEGEKLGELVAQPASRRARAGFRLLPAADDPQGVAALKGLLAALYAGFVLDVDVFLLDSEEESRG
jgi:hypothetical protein